MLQGPKSQKICRSELTIGAARRRRGEMVMGQHRNENMPMMPPCLKNGLASTPGHPTRICWDQWKNMFTRKSPES